MADYMAEMGAPKEMIDLALQTDLAAVTYVDHAKLRQWGLVNSPLHAPKRSPKFRAKVRLVCTAVKAVRSRLRAHG